MMRSLPIALLLIFAVPSAFAQVAAPVAVPAQSLHATPSLSPVPSLPAALTPKTIGLAYPDTTQPLLWRVPSTYTSTSGDFTSMNVSQRFTLPTIDGFLDSIYVLIQELPLGQMRFDVIEDVMRPQNQTDTAKYHYPNYWDLARSVRDTAVLKSTEIVQNHFALVKFGHHVVPQEFHIAASPMTAGGISSMFGIVSDSHPGDMKNMKPELSRTVMLFSYQQQVIPLQLWGVFSTQTGPVAPNLWMVAWVEVDMATGLQTVAVPSGPMLFDSYPNPASMTADIMFAASEPGRAVLDVYDQMGRKVATVADEDVTMGLHHRTIDVHALPAGTYVTRLTIGGTQFTRRLTVVR